MISFPVYRVRPGRAPDELAREQPEMHAFRARPRGRSTPGSLSAVQKKRARATRPVATASGRGRPAQMRMQASGTQKRGVHPVKWPNWAKRFFLATLGWVSHPKSVMI